VPAPARLIDAAPSPSAGPTAAPPARANAPAPAPSTNKRDDRKQQAQARSALASRTRPLRMEIQQIDGRLEKLAAEKAEIEATLATGTLPGPQIADAGRRLAHVGAEVQMLEERWLELQASIEAMEAGGG
jgi:ATP-binding cassette, subfamily F, member 3